MKKLLLAIAFSGCAATIPGTDQVRIHAAHDFQCNAEQVQTTQLDPRTIKANACGHETTYVEECATEGTTRCTWVARAGGGSTGSTVNP